MKIDWLGVSAAASATPRAGKSRFPINLFSVPSVARFSRFGGRRTQTRELAPILDTHFDTEQRA